MKITLDLDVLPALRDAALLTPSIPIPPPELLKRAKAIGALNAGPPNLGARASAVDLTAAGASGKPVGRAPKKKVAKRAGRKSAR